MDPGDNGFVANSYVMGNVTSLHPANVHPVRRRSRLLTRRA